MSSHVWNRILTLIGACTIAPLQRFARIQLEDARGFRSPLRRFQARSHQRGGQTAKAWSCDRL